ncbi:MAG: hypothetical protein ACI8PZ_007118 [Myxococcota bacterium]
MVGRVWADDSTLGPANGPVHAPSRAHGRYPGSMIVALMASAALALSPSEIGFADALDLPDRLGWAASDREVRRFVRDAAEPDAVFARSIKEGQRASLRVLDDPTIYAVRATLRSLPDGPFLELIESVVFTNDSKVPLDTLAFRVLPAGQDVWSSGVLVRGVFVGGKAAVWALEDTVLGVALERPLRPGETVRVMLDVVQRVPRFRKRTSAEVDRLTPEATGAYGFHEQAGESYINLGYWLPMLTPVSDDGTWDVRRLPRNGEHTWFEPAMFLVALTVPPGVEVATTGVEIGREVAAGQTTVVATAAATREFAVNIGDFDVVEQEVGGTRVRVFHPAGQSEVGAHLLAYASDALAFFEASLGELPDRELDIVETPVSVALGIEFPGLVTVDTGHGSGTYRKSPSHEWTVAHEVAHQWWYGVVGNDAQLEPWVDEALTSATAAAYWERRYGRDSLEGLYELDVVEPYREMYDRGLTDLPAHLPGARYDLRRYAAVVYGKAVLFFDRVRVEMGDAVFLRVLAAHYREHRFGDTSGDDLLASFLADPGTRPAVQALYDRWIAGAHGFEDILGRTR